MNIYLIERTDEVEYDQTHGFVIVSNDELECVQLAKGSLGHYDVSSVWDEACITLLGIYSGDLNYSHIVLTDFNAG